MGGSSARGAAGLASIVIPAHDEEASIARLLGSLKAGAQPSEFEVLVVCNGCSDRTAEVARSFGVQVVELAEPSKAAALAHGDSLAHHYPRLYVDADVDLDVPAVRALCAALDGDVLAAGPRRELVLDEASSLVRAYYAVWSRLPQVRTGLFGRGVVAVSAAGHERTRALPAVMSDDLAMSEAFAPAERAVVDEAVVMIRTPRTLRDLLRRRIRVATGNTQLDQVGGRSDAAKTSWADLLRLARTEPRVVSGVPVFVAVAVVARLASRRRVRSGDFSTWLRDDSSRRTRRGALPLPDIPPQVDILVAVVTYNSEDVVADLLKTMPDALEGCSWHLVVADNDSRDQTLAVVKELQPGATIVETGRNAGYAAGINAAVAAGPSARSVLILNPDNRLEPGSIAALRAKLDEPGVGIVVPRLLGSRGNLGLTLRREPNIRRALGDMLLSARFAGRFPMWSELVTDSRCYAEDSTADWAAGPIMLVSRECFAACEGWDESFFLYSEETEFCLRARDRGYRLVLTPDAEAIHLGGDSGSSPTLRALHLVNRVVLYRRSHSSVATGAFWLVTVLREASRLPLRRPVTRHALAALLVPGRARATIAEAARQLPDLDRRRALAQAAATMPPR
jgi:N-acetylglucosaminyl-diphospho-decaprenol L-rhamnosyltransferase